MAVKASTRAPAVRLTGVRRRPASEWWLPLGMAAVLAAVSMAPYLYAHAVQGPGRVFMGFFFLGDDANTYLAKMRQGWEGNWIWTNRYSSEPSPGAYFFLYWIALGHLAALLQLPLLAVFHIARVAGAFLLMGAGWLFMKRFVDGEGARRFAIVLFGLGLGCGYVIAALRHPEIFGQQTDALDWRMPELSAFYSILALPHFAWAAAFQAFAIVLTLRAAERGSLLVGALAGLAWFAEETIHAQMPLLIGAALLVALLVRRVSPRGYVAVAVAALIATPYIGYSYYESVHAPEVLRWSAQWRNNLPPDLVSLTLALLPQLFLAAFAIPAALRRRSREDVFLLAWLVLLAVILWTPNPAANLRRRFFDGVSLPLVALAARGMYQAVVPRLHSLRARRLVPFGFVCFTSLGSATLLLAPFLLAGASQYSVSRDEYDALGWLGSQPAGVVLSSDRIGLYVPAYSPDTAYVGQYSETWMWREKGLEAKRLLTGETPIASAPAGVRYLLWSDDYSPQPPAGFPAPAFDRPGAKVYRLP